MKYLILCLLILPAWAVNFDPYAYCSAIKHCLGRTSGACEEKHYTKNEDIDYNAAFCSEVEEAFSLLGNTNTSSSQKVMSLLGKEYRMIYPVSGELPISENQMHYLLDNLPFSAHLINAYNESEYKAKYLTPSKKVFKGSNGRSLRGRFRWAHKKKSSNQMMAFGDGYAKVLMWNLKGTAIVYIDFQPLGPQKIAFQVKCIAFPGGAMLNGIMSMGIFQNMVKKKINKIIKDVVHAANEYGSGNTAPISKIKALKEPQGQKWLEEWNAIIEADLAPQGEE